MQFQPQVVSPHDPVIARKNRITLVLLLSLVAAMVAGTVIGRESVYEAMTKNKSAHSKR